MKKLILTISAVFILGNGTAIAKACEKHDHQTVPSSKLSSDSLYQLDSPWADHENKTVNLSSLAGKHRILAMVYTKCHTACPLLVQDIKEMMSQIPKNLADKVHVDLFSFDSDSENYKSLQSFKSKYKLTENWSAYSGSKSSVAELAAALGIQYKKLPSGDYIHSNVIFFLNEKGEIVAKHEGLGRSVSEFIKKVEDSFKVSDKAGGNGTI